MIRRKHTKYYERSNKVDYMMESGVYCTTHDVKVTFCMPEFSSSKITNHHFHVNNDTGESGIVNEMIKGSDLMVQLGLTSNFKRQILQWDGTALHMKEPSGLLGKSNVNKREMHEVVLQTAEPASIIEATEIMVKILNSNYSKSYLKKVANNATQPNAE